MVISIKYVKGMGYLSYSELNNIIFYLFIYLLVRLRSRDRERTLLFDVVDRLLREVERDLVRDRRFLCFTRCRDRVADLLLDLPIFVKTYLSRYYAQILKQNTENQI